jgi:hypothetical protein
MYGTRSHTTEMETFGSQDLVQKKGRQMIQTNIGGRRGMLFIQSSHKIGNWKTSSNIRECAAWRAVRFQTSKLHSTFTHETSK